MLADKLKEKDVRFNNSSINFSCKIRDAIVFKIDENMDSFSDEYINSLIKSNSTGSILSQSFLPYNNLILNFNDGCLWFMQLYLPKEDTTVIISTNGIPNELLPSIPYQGEMYQAYAIYLKQDSFGLYYLPDEYDKTNFSIAYGIHELDINSKQYKVLLYFLVILHKFLSYLSCKNITYIQEDPPEKLQRKRQKQGKQPLSSYYVLKLKPTTTRKDYEAKNLWTNRVHLCRGHIREYTAERPLFGKYTGRFWIPPHVRGDKKQGVINKDYEVETKN